MKKNVLLFTVVMVLALFLTGCETKIIESDDENINTINVQGSATVAAAPDEANIFIRIETRADTAQRAEDDARAKANQVMGALKQHGVKEADIQTTQFSLNPQWDWTEEGQKFRGYMLYHVMKVTSKDVENTGKLVDAAITAGANAIDSVQFTLSKEKRKDVFGEALQRAAEEAESKAQSLGSTLGITVGKPTQIMEQNFNYIPYDYRGGVAMAETADAKMMPPTPISPQEVEVTATVQVNFLIE